MRQTIIGLLLAIVGLLAPLTLERFMSRAPEWAWRLVSLVCVLGGIIIVLLSDPIYSRLHGARATRIGSTLIAALAAAVAFGAVWWFLFPSIRSDQPPPPAAVELSQTEKALQRIEFLAQRGKPVQKVRFLISLIRPFRPDEVGHFRILLEVIELDTGEPHPTLWIAARDAYPIWHRGEQATKVDGIRTIVWSRNPDETLQDTVVGAAVGPQMSEMLAWGVINQRGPFQTMDSFDNKWLNIFVTESLEDKIAYVSFAIDNYVMLGLPISCLDVVQTQPLVEWPDGLPENEQAARWIQLLPRRYWPDDETRPPLRPPLLIDFSRFTPAKLEPSGELRGWSPITVPRCDLAKVWPP